MPSWVRERLGIPLGKKPGEQEQAYIRQFGLPFDELAELSFRSDRPWMPLDLERTAKRQLAKAAPGIGVGYKLLTGEDPYTGRAIKTLKGPTGIPTLDTFFQMAPVAPRMRTEFYLKGQRLAQRPGLTALDLLTGVKMGQYDPERWKLLDLEKAQTELLEAHPENREFTRLYLPADQKEANPELVEQLGLLNLLIQARRKQASQRPAK